MAQSVLVLSALELALVVSSQAQASRGDSYNAQAASVPVVQHSIRKVFSCGINIAALVVSNAVAISKLRRAGGVRQIARKMLRTNGKLGKLKVLASVVGEISGINQVVEAYT
jgi:hypothetical protein